MLTPLPPYCAVVVKFGNINFLEPSGPLQACNGTAFTESRVILLSVYMTAVLCFVMVMALFRRVICLSKIDRLIKFGYLTLDVSKLAGLLMIFH